MTSNLDAIEEAWSRLDEEFPDRTDVMLLVDVARAAGELLILLREHWEPSESRILAVNRLHDALAPLLTDSVSEFVPFGESVLPSHG